MRVSAVSSCPALLERMRPRWDNPNHALVEQKDSYIYSPTLEAISDVIVLSRQYTHQSICEPGKTMQNECRKTSMAWTSRGFYCGYGAAIISSSADQASRLIINCGGTTQEVSMAPSVGNLFFSIAGKHHNEVASITSSRSTSLLLTSMSTVHELVEEIATKEIRAGRRLPTIIQAIAPMTRI